MDQTDFSILKHPHDGYFKWLFSRIACVLSFLSNYLCFGEWKLDIEIIPLDSVLTGSDLRENRTDILYKVTVLGFGFYVYVLLEHKSRKHIRTPVQINGYLDRIYEKLSAALKKKGDQMSLVIPVVVYHGKSQWDIPRNFIDLIRIPKGFEVLRKYGVSFEYEVIDLARDSFENIKGNFPLRLGFRLLKAGSMEETVQAFTLTLDEFEEEIEKLSDEELNYELATPMIYSVQAMRVPRRVIREAVVDTLEKKGRKMAKTWLEKDLDKSFEKGKLEGKLEALESILSLRFGNDARSVIMKVKTISNLDVAEKVQIAIGKAKDAVELEKLISRIRFD
ncbi:MAG: Rpn family recombination-promoting nuclease/putative transposase [Planctomycetes bacterium]|nr:Rpn family recombination-promoting nuclease/putative transposase [Planctomycetota bacterium]